MNKLLTIVLMAIPILRAQAQLVLPSCKANAICPAFYAPAFIGDGSQLTNIPGGAPSGAAGGNLSGTYPNPSIGSLPAISGANLTNLTGANVTGNISGRAGSVASGGVDFSTITTAFSLKANLSGTSAITVTGTSVTANAFFGDGSALTGVTATEANTYASSKTFTNNVLGRSSVTASAFFGDGGDLNAIIISSFTRVPNSAFTNTTYTAAVATVTIVTRSNTQLYAVFNGVFTNSTSNIEQFASVWVDGAVPADFGGSMKDIGACVPAQGGDFCSINYIFPLGTFSAGTHTVALMVRVTANTGTLHNSATVTNSFGAVGWRR